ncbi:MAG: histidine phosphatase family protein [Bacteriovoracaceae bacterium]
MISLYLIRHAESDLNVKTELIFGRQNHIALTDRGRKQAELTGKRLADEKKIFDFIFSSPAVRALETAKIVARATGFPVSKIVTSDLLQELCQGEWEGRKRKEVYGEDTLKRYINEANFKAPAGESRAEVEKRMKKFLEKEVLIKEKKDQVVKIAVFSHGMSLKCLLRSIMRFHISFTYTMRLRNASITHLVFDDGNWFVPAISDHSHCRELA